MVRIRWKHLHGWMRKKSICSRKYTKTIRTLRSCLHSSEIVLAFLHCLVLSEQYARKWPAVLRRRHDVSSITRFVSPAHAVGDGRHVDSFPSYVETGEDDLEFDW